MFKWKAIFIQDSYSYFYSFMVGEQKGCTHFAASKCQKNLFISSNPECKRCGAGKDNLWVCLNRDCEQMHCGRRQFEHLTMHFQQSKKKKHFHSLFINIATAEILCVACRQMIQDQKSQNEMESSAIMKIRAKVLPYLKDFQRFSINGQIQNSQAHRKISRDSVGLFSNQYNHSIHSALQFLVHCSYLKEIVLNLSLKGEEKVLFELQNVMREMNEARYRAIHAEKLDKAIYAIKPELLTYQRKDPLDILLLFLQKLHQKLRYPSLSSTHTYSEHDEWSLFHLKSHPLKLICPVYDSIEIKLRLNYHCAKCKINDYYLKTINFLKLVLQKKKRGTREVERDLTEYRGESPLKKRKSSLMNLFFKEQQMPLSVHQLLVDMMRRPLHKERQCQNCKEPLKKSKIQIQSLPNYLVIQICRMSAEGYGIDQTPVSFSTSEVDFGAFTVNKDTPQLYTFQTAIGIEKGLFPVMARNNHNKQFQMFKNENISFESKLNPYILCYKIKPKEKSVELYSQIKNSLENKRGEYVLPDFWMLQLKHGFEGDLFNPFICKHGSLKPGIVSKEAQQIRVDREHYEDIAYQYHGRVYEPLQCRQCLDDLETIQRRRKQEREAIKKYDSVKIDITCMISLDWITKWSAFLYKRENPMYMHKGHPPPGKIDNSSILEGKKCKPHLLLNRDFKVVNYYIWRFLKQLYGGGPEIRYKWRQDGKIFLNESLLNEARSEGRKLRQLLIELPFQSPSKKSSTMQQSSYISEDQSEITSRMEREV